MGPLEKGFRARAKRRKWPPAVAEGFALAWRRLDERRADKDWFEKARREVPSPELKCPRCGKDASNSGLRVEGRFFCNGVCLMEWKASQPEEQDFQWRRELWRRQEAKEAREVADLARR